MKIACDYCGKQLNRKPSAILDHNFCNRQCYGPWKAIQMQGERSERITKTCVGCGDSFDVLPHRASTACYCSAECRKQRVIRPCAHCGKPVERLQNEVDKMPNSFCDQSCYSEWRKTLTGESAPRWSGGHHDYYGHDWASQRRKARERDRYTCQRCGATESELGITLDVHHIKPFRSFGLARHTEANVLSNLVSLCDRCHALVENGAPLQLSLVAV